MIQDLVLTSETQRVWRFVHTHDAADATTLPQAKEKQFYGGYWQSARVRHELLSLASYLNVVAHACMYCMFLLTYLTYSTY
jgi:hypothetical protein